MNRGAIAAIDLSALANNLKVIRSICRERHVIAVVKADAYGHGSVQIAKRLVDEGAFLLAVAYTGEAISLREAGVKAGIIVLFDHGEIADYLDYDLIPVISDLKTAEALSKSAAQRGKRLQAHLKVDTGMGRAGMRPDDVMAAVASISNMEGLELTGLMSHFSEADLADRSFATHQLDLFQSVKEKISRTIGRPLLAHVANSAAVVSFDASHMDAVRPGLMLYGYSPFKDANGLVPVMTVRSRVLMVRDMPEGTPISYGRTFVTSRRSRIALVPIGYADGFSRLFSNNGLMLVRGRRAPVVGRVCMDLTMIDVTDIDGVSENDEVVILGRQANESLSADELASKIGTISYDILTSIGSRSRKEYIP